MNDTHKYFEQEIEQKFQLEIVSHSSNTRFYSEHNGEPFTIFVIVINDSSKF